MNRAIAIEIGSYPSAPHWDSDLNLPGISLEKEAYDFVIGGDEK